MLSAPLWQFFKKGLDLNEAKSFSWRDQTLRFDLKPSELALASGEVIIDSCYPIEDIKGNLGQSGLLQVTNLRIIWIYQDKPKINISIGFGPVLNAFRRATRTALGETCESVCILAKYESVKYEFIFKRLTLPPKASLSQSDQIADGVATLAPQQLSCQALRSNVDPCELVMKVWNAYRSTISFRRCRVNLSSLHTNGEVNLLNSEEIHERYMNISHKNREGIWSDGMLILTNIRIIWMRKKNHNENISIPYIQVESAKPHTKFRDSYWRFVLDLKIYCRYSERYIDQRKFEALCEQINNLTNTYKERPRFGPEVSDECKLLIQQSRRKSGTDNGARANPNETQLVLDTSKVDDTSSQYDLTDDIDSSMIRSGYKSGDTILNDREPFYHNGTGLAFESTAANAKIESIWRMES